MHNLMEVTVVKGPGGKTKMTLPGLLISDDEICHQPDRTHLYNPHWQKDSTDPDLNDEFIKASATLACLNLQVGLQRHFKHDYQTKLLIKTRNGVVLP